MLKDIGGGVVGVERHLLLAVGEAERAKIVEAEDVVGVGVGVEDSVDVADAEAQRLLAEVRAGVDEDAMRRGGVAVLPFDGDRGAKALVAWIGGGADVGRCSPAWARPWRCRCRETGCWR